MYKIQPFKYINAFKRAIVIGETNLCTQCAKYLIANQWKVIFIVSDDPLVISWAKSHAIVVLASNKLCTIEEDGFYLFSIINPQIIPESFLKTKNILAINYHDSYLPKYAGINSTTWAIINNERTHGVTLHQITPGIDDGDVVAQAKIDIDKDETAVSLNLKCSEQLLLLFKEVITKIEAGVLNLSKQDLTTRSYYGSKHIPANYGIINGIKDLAELSRLTRGLTFGSGYDNQVATVKVFLNGQFYIAEDFNIELIRSNYAPDNHTILFNTVRDIYGNKTDRKITYQDISRDLFLSNDDLQYLSNIKTQERKYKKQILEVLNNSDASIAMLDHAFIGSDNKRYLQEFTMPNDIQTDTVFTLLYFVLTRLFYSNSFIVSLYADNSDIPKALRGLVERRNFIHVHSAMLNNNFKCLTDHLVQIRKNSYILTKDFSYRYGLQLLTDIAIIIEKVECIDKHKILIKIENNTVVVDGDAIYQLQIDSIAEAIETVFSKNTREELITKNLKTISILSDARYQQIVYEWNQTEKDYPRDKTIHQLFEEQVARTPNNIAVVYEDTRLTYQELNQKANQLAHYLCKNYNIKPDDLVALCLDRSEQMLVAILGVLKAGGAYVPIDPGYPDERIRYVLNDTKAAVLIMNEAYTNKILQLTKQKPELKNIDAVAIDNKAIQIKLAKQKINNPITLAKSTDLVYVIYTSGTTGKPKGVMIEHKNMVNFINNVVQFLETQDVTMSYINYSFDAINAEIYPALLNGNLLHILNKESRGSLEDLYKYIIKNNITFIVLPAVVATEFSLNYDLSVTKLRAMIVGGDTYRGKLGQIKIINQYGPTECTVCATIYQYQKGDAYAVIGKPISNATCYVLDDNLAVLPTGAIGELFISGDGLAKGYLNSLKVTKEKFISNPFQTKEEKLQNRNNRLYRTGDLVRWLPNGNLEFIGRNDEQVKIRGYRIELGEIENKLLSYPGIKQAAVIVQEKSNNKCLLAYYVADKKLDETNIQAYLSSNLPEYMLPQTLIYIDKLPLTANGKLDKQSLPEPEFMNQSAYVAPRTELEKNICEIYAQVLNLPKGQIGIKHDFFRMGGDSISSIQFVYRIRYKLPFNISVADVYAHRNAEQLAKNILIKQSTAKKTTNIKQETKPLGHADLLPIQEWFFENVKNGLYPKHHHWNQAFIIKTPELDLEILKLSVIKLLEHHDAFRLRYKNSQQAYVEIDFSKELADIEKIDVSALQAAELKHKLIETQSSFNIETGPVHAIAYLYGYQDKTARLFFALHHLIVDSVSWRILAHDIAKLYQLLQDKDNIHKTSQELLGAKGTSYRQWIEEIKNYQPNQTELTHWEDTLKNHISIFPKTNEQSYTDFSLPSQSTQQLLTKVNETYNTQINDILLSALARTLSQVFYRQVNHITLEGHGREGINEQIDITKTVGWFTTMYPVRLVDHDAIPDLIKATKENLRRIPNKGIGYGATKGYKKLPLINFNYLGQLHNTTEFWTIVDHIISIDPQNQNNNMLDIHGYVVNSTLKFHVSCNDSLPFDAKDFADKYKSNLEKLISHCMANHEVAEKNCKNLKYVQDGSMYKLLHQVKLSYASKTNENPVNKQLQSKIDCYLKNANSLSQDLFLKKPIANVLLTGSTGFLGCNLLNQLLKLTDYNVFLLVRADSQIAAVTRISKKFKFYFDETLDEFYEKRIFVLKSNITGNNLGLSEKEYKDLSLKIDSIIHAAALVKHYGDYDDFYLQNVQSTINLLELAKLTKLKDFHYVSTYSVLNNSRKPICTEEDISNEAEQDNVYLKTKSQGEHQVIKYRDYGIRSNIYRVGTLTFIAENLRTQENVEENGFLNWVNCIYKLRCVAKEINSVKISPVDLTARAIVKLFDKNSLSNKTHHVFTPYSFNISESISKIEVCSIDKFIDRMIDEIKYGINDNLVMKFLLYQGWMDNAYTKNTKAVEILQDRTQYILKHLDFTWTLEGIKTFFDKYYKLLDIKRT